MLKHLAQVSLPFSMMSLRTRFPVPFRVQRDIRRDPIPPVSPTGFGYPLGDVSPQAPESLSQLPTLRGFPLQSLPPRSDPYPVSRISSAPTLSYKTFSALYRRSRGLLPLPSRPAARVRFFPSPVQALALMKFRASRVFLRPAQEKAPAFLFRPPALQSPPFDLGRNEPQGSPLSGSASPRFRGRPPV